MSLTTSYATVEDVKAGFRELTEDEETRCEQLLKEAAVLIDAIAADASADAKLVVSCRTVRRALGDGEEAVVPMGATQGSMSAGGYSQSWTISNGASGELYLGRTEKLLLGVGNRIGARSPLEGMVQT